jgi:hypothetical protein
MTVKPKRHNQQIASAVVPGILPVLARAWPTILCMPGSPLPLLFKVLASALPPVSPDSIRNSAD